MTIDSKNPEGLQVTLSSASHPFLIVVHAQPEMVSQVPQRALSQLCDALRNAELCGRKIVFLELTEHEPTLSGLIAISPDALVLRHEGTDGSDVFCRHLEEQDLCCSDILLCGFFAHACVYDTVLGLRARLRERPLAVLQKACDPSDAFVWQRISKVAGIQS